jgi:hypothetical protein
LTHKAAKAGYNSKVITSGRFVNDSMGGYVAKQTVKKMIAQGNKLNGVIQKMKTVNLSMELQNKFIEEAAKLRDSKLTATDIKLTVNRPEDSGDSVYLVLNRIQEALVTGGIRYKTQKGKERKMRPLKNINRLVDVNAELFDLAQKYTDMGVAA